MVNGGLESQVGEDESEVVALVGDMEKTPSSSWTVIKSPVYRLTPFCEGIACGIWNGVPRKAPITIAPESVATSSSRSLLSLTITSLGPRDTTTLVKRRCPGCRNVDRRLR